MEHGHRCKIDSGYELAIWKEIATFTCLVVVFIPLQCTIVLASI
jgi:hypothetical protein